MRIDLNKEESVSNYCTKTFAALDKCLHQVSKELGEGALDFVKQSMKNNVQANIAYYEGTAKQLASDGERQLATKYEFLAKLYKGLPS